MGWPLRAGREIPGVRRLVRLPARRRHGLDRDGARARLSRQRDLRPRSAPGAEDASKLMRELLEGGERAAVGCEDDSIQRVRRSAEEVPCTRAAALRVTASGWSTCPASRGSITRSRSAGSPRRLRGGRLSGARRRAGRDVRRGGERVVIWNDLREVRNMRQAFGLWLYVYGGAMAGSDDGDEGLASRRATSADGARRRSDADHDRSRAVVSRRRTGS